MSSSQIKALATTRRVNPVISIYSPATGIVDGTEKMMATTNGSMQNVVTTTSPLGLKEGDYIDKNAVVFKLVNTNRVWGVFVDQGMGIVTIPIKLNCWGLSPKANMWSYFTPNSGNIFDFSVAIFN